MSRIADVRRQILNRNDARASQLRDRFNDARLLVISLVSSPGAGKTLLLEKTMRMLRARHRVAALVGDLATARDAERLALTGARVRQIETGTVCHLDAFMIDAALTDWTVGDLDILFIENVGNLVCPASYDLGEHWRVVLLSVTEGEDKPLKYPTIFNTADAAVITKIDLADAVDFNRDEAHQHIQDIRPGLNVFEVSAKSAVGMQEWIAAIEMRRAAQAWGARETGRP